MLTRVKEWLLKCSWPHEKVNDLEPWNVHATSHIHPVVHFKFYGQFQVGLVANWITYWTAKSKKTSMISTRIITSTFGLKSLRKLQCNPDIRELSGPENIYLISEFLLYPVLLYLGYTVLSPWSTNYLLNRTISVTWYKSEYFLYIMLNMKLN